MAIKTIMTACGQGLGSSFMIEINVNKVLKSLGIEGIEVSHGSAADVYPGVADLLIVGEDLYDSVSGSGDVVTLRNIVSLPELQEKLETYFKDKGVL